jgi:NAD(P)-dependent dehydrogenase (short-subunit alcohol dehydrogenase family)
VQPGSFNPHYAITKAATLNLSKFLANYFVNDKVLVNSVCPGSIHSESWNANVSRVAAQDKLSYEAAWFATETEEQKKIPLGRVGEGIDVASLVAFLASDKAGYITGSCFHVNGGKLRSL